MLAFILGTLSYTVSHLRRLQKNNSRNATDEIRADDQFFDPIRAFFVRSKLEGTFDLEQYGPIKCTCSPYRHIESHLELAKRPTRLHAGIKQQLGLVGDSLAFLRGNAGPQQSAMSVGQNAWQDRIAAEKEVDRWLSEYPSTFITVTGPPGSGKVSLVNRVLKKREK